MRGAIVLRADATVRMGAGHVMRCLALAQAAKAGGIPCIFACADAPGALLERVHAEGFHSRSLAVVPGSPQDAAELAALAKQVNASWVVIDGYHFFESYQAHLKDSGARLLAIDDYGHCRHYLADIVVNPSPKVSRSLYDVDQQQTNLLLGPRYALLRREFWAGPPPRAIPEVARNLLLTLGGTDPDNVTSMVLRAIVNMSAELSNTIVVVGGSNPHYESLVEQVRLMQGSVSIVRDPPSMAELMCLADVAISASGGTALELASMSVPTLVLSIADNQRPIANSLDEAGAAINLGCTSDVSVATMADAIADLIANPVRRLELSSNGRALIDGRGAQRVAQVMVKTPPGINEAPISIRAADYEDAHLLWAWANEPAVRAVSFSSEPIAWDEHLRWMARKLNDKACRLYIGLNENSEPIGQVRLDINDEVATLSVGLDARFRGHGYGTALIRKVALELFRTTSVRTIEALVKPANEPSLRAFRKARFIDAGRRRFHDHDAICLVLARYNPSS